MGNKRTTYDIIRDMLSLCKEGVMRTNLMIGAKISFDLLKKYLYLLNQWGLIEERGDRKLYLTPKGAIALNLLNKLDEFKKEVSRIETTLNELLPMDSPVVENATLRRIKDLLESKGIPFQLTRKGIRLEGIEICEESSCNKKVFFFKTPRVIIGERFSIYANDKSISILENEKIEKLLQEVIEKR
ncbi:MAG: winged helix-turn-helix domain-containing protein [Metallosphaera sp.]